MRPGPLADGVVLSIADPRSQKRDVGHPDFLDGEDRE